MTANQLSPSEYLPFYGNYIKKAGTKDLIFGLEHGLIETIKLFETIPGDRLEYRYAEGKWTIKDIIQHLLDAERIFAYRILRIARQDKTPLHGFEENDYAKKTLANNRSRADLIEEYKVIRQSTLSLVKSLNDPMLKSMGIVNNGKMSVRAIGFIIIGHEKHHCEVINKRYL
jgi:uncharacterized damage-inducible protein DinB